MASPGPREELIHAFDCTDLSTYVLGPNATEREIVKLGAIFRLTLSPGTTRKIIQIRDKVVARTKERP